MIGLEGRRNCAPRKTRKRKPLVGNAGRPLGIVPDLWCGFCDARALRRWALRPLRADACESGPSPSFRFRIGVRVHHVPFDLIHVGPGSGDNVRNGRVFLLPGGAPALSWARALPHAAAPRPGWPARMSRPRGQRRRRMSPTCSHTRAAFDPAPRYNRIIIFYMPCRPYPRPVMVTTGPRRPFPVPCCGDRPGPGGRRACPGREAKGAGAYPDTFSRPEPAAAN